MLASLLRQQAHRRQGGDRLTIASAGIDARFGDPAATGSQRVAVEMGLSLADHRSQPVSYVDLAAPRLIVTMTRRQRHLMSSAADGLAPRVFAVRELVRALDRMPQLDTREQLLGRARCSADRLVWKTTLANVYRPNTRFRPSIDIPDPIGGDHRTFQRLGAEFRVVATTLADHLFGPAKE